MENYAKEAKEAKEAEAKAEILKEFYSASRKLLESKNPCLLASVFRSLREGDRLAVWETQGEIVFLELVKCTRENNKFHLFGKPKKDEERCRTQCGIAVWADESSWIKLIR